MCTNLCVYMYVSVCTHVYEYVYECMFVGVLIYMWKCLRVCVFLEIGKWLEIIIRSFSPGNTRTHFSPTDLAHEQFPSEKGSPTQVPRFPLYR